jgi:GAF domain-containing protein
VYRSADVVGLPLAEVVSPAVQDEVLRAVRQVSRTGGQWESKELEFGFPGRAATFWNLTVLSLREADAGPPHEVALILVDVTEEVKARRTLEQTADEKTRLLEELAERERLAAALNRLNGIIGSNLAPEEILRQVTEDVRGVLDVEAAGVSLRLAGQWEVRYASGRAAHLVGLRLPDRAVPLSVLAVESGEVQVVQDAESDPRARGSAVGNTGVKSYLVTPLLVNGEAIGILGFSQFTRPISFTPAQIAFATQLAASLSQALERARLVAGGEEAASHPQDGPDAARPTRPPAPSSL